MMAMKGLRTPSSSRSPAMGPQSMATGPGHDPARAKIAKAQTEHHYLMSPFDPLWPVHESVEVTWEHRKRMQAECAKFLFAFWT